MAIHMNVNSLHPRIPWTKFYCNFNIVNVFSLFHDYLPFKKSVPFIWTTLNSLHQRHNQGGFVPSLDKISPVVLILFVDNLFSLFRNKECGYINPLHPRMFCAKFDWNWPSGSIGVGFHITWVTQVTYCYGLASVVRRPLTTTWPILTKLVYAASIG